LLFVVFSIKNLNSSISISTILEFEYFIKF
jgi:hypothetical protein